MSSWLLAFFLLLFFFLLLWHGWWWVCSVFVGRIANSEGNDNVGSDRTTQVWMGAEATASTVWPFQSVMLGKKSRLFCMPSLFALGTGLLFFFSVFFFFFCVCVLFFVCLFLIICSCQYARLIYATCVRTMRNRPPKWKRRHVRVRSIIN